MERELLLLYIMAAFTGVAAVALLVMMGFMISSYFAIRAMQQRSAVFMDRFEPLADTSQQTLDLVRSQSTEILHKVDGIAASTHGSVQKIDKILTEVSITTKVQLDRVDHLVADTVGRLNDVAIAMQKTVMAPVRQARGVAAGVAAMLGSLAGRRRSNVDQATIDEEMFI